MRRRLGCSLYAPSRGLWVSGLQVKIRLSYMERLLQQAAETAGRDAGHVVRAKSDCGAHTGSAVMARKALSRSGVTRVSSSM